MPQTLRVLIADDSAVIRRLLTEVLTSDAEIEIVGSVRNGAEAVASFKDSKPDCVILDVEMPVMDGLEAVRQIRAIDRDTPVIMFSSLTERGAETSLEALSRGATEVAVKPSGVGHVSQAIEFVRRDVLPKVKLLGRREILRRIATSLPTSLNIPRPPVAAALRAAVARPLSPGLGRARAGSAELVAIGSSTGGPNALADVIRELDSRIGAPILIVQHMPPLFTQLLADRLNSLTTLSVREAKDGDLVQRGGVWIAPGNYHMTLCRKGLDLVLKLNQDAAVNSCRPSVDILFSSVASVMGPKALGVVLTGMGRDGCDGAAEMRRGGARILAQNEATCVVYGMPRAVVEANLADQVLPLGEIAAAINAGCVPMTRMAAVST